MAANLNAEDTTGPPAGPVAKPKKATLSPVVVAFDTARYAVASASDPGTWRYVLLRPEAGYVCTCPGHHHRGHCRHGRAVFDALADRLPVYLVPRWPTR